MLKVLFKVAKYVPFDFYTTSTLQTKQNKAKTSKIPIVWPLLSFFTVKMLVQQQQKSQKLER